MGELLKMLSSIEIDYAGPGVRHADIGWLIMRVKVADDHIASLNANADMNARCFNAKRVELEAELAAKDIELGQVKAQLETARGVIADLRRVGR